MIILNPDVCSHEEALRVTKPFGQHKIVRGCTECGSVAGTVDVRPDGRPDLQIIPGGEDAAS